MTRQMQRRDFLAATSALVAAGFSSAMCFADALPPDICITRIVGFDVTNRRPKMVGKNARLGVHGDHSTDRMVRLYTNTGIEGVGNCRVAEAELRPLIGKSLANIGEPSALRVRSLDNGTMPVWDLIGKVLRKPMYEVLGNKGPERVK